MASGKEEALWLPFGGCFKATQTRQHPRWAAKPHTNHVHSLPEGRSERRSAHSGPRKLTYTPLLQVRVSLRGPSDLSSVSAWESPSSLESWAGWQALRLSFSVFTSQCSAASKGKPWERHSDNRMRKKSSVLLISHFCECLTFYDNLPLVVKCWKCICNENTNYTICT